MGWSSPLDVVIVGAGAAGIGAALRADALGLRYAVVEAMPRIGGRAFTDPRPFGVPWDVGCHWLHSASRNDFRVLADGYGIRYRAEPTPWFGVVDGRRLGADRLRDDERYEEASYSVAIQAGNDGRDVPLASLVDTSNPAYASLHMSMRHEWGVGPEEVSALDVAAYAAAATDEDWPVEDGYGALVARHAAGVPVSLSTAVRSIAWGRSPLRVLTEHGTLEARRIIVTVSTNVLADELIAFDPPLPAWKLEAAAATPLGYANKIGLAIEGQLLGVDGQTGVAVMSERNPADGMAFQLRPFGWDLANGYIGGAICDELERAGEAAMVDYAVSALRDALGTDVARYVTAAAVSRWASEPFIRGAYAAKRPGTGDQRALLRQPVEDRLFFAGEATSPDAFSTCHGAYLSGVAAVDALAALSDAAMVAGARPA